MSLAHRSRFEQYYAEGNTPWDTRETPPEVHRFWAGRGAVETGRALDLGCGPGTNVAFLARRGLHTVGVDYVLAPLHTAQRRLAKAPDAAARAAFVLADVTRLPFSGLGARYILDVGCLHGIPPEARQGYVQGVVENLAPGGHYHLYAFDRVPELEQEPDRIRGMTENEVAERFAPWLEVVTIERARPDRHPCRWYLLQRKG